MRDQDDVFVSRHHNGWHRPTQVKHKKRRRPFLTFVVLMTVGFILLYGYIFLAPQFAGPSIDDAQEPINGIIASHPDYDIGVSLVDIESGDTLDLGKQTPFTAASTTKLLTAALTMREVEKERLTLDKKLEGSPVSWHLQQLVNQSNSESWVTLNYYFGKKKMSEYAKSIGITTYNYDKNTIAPQDLALLLQKLYNGELMNKAHTKTILGYMQQTNEERFIPSVADTQDVTVYHKYGWFESNIHDVAILKSKDATWVLAVYTHPKDNDMDAGTSTEIIHAITEATLGAMQRTL